MTKKKFQNGNFLHIFLFQALDTIGQHCTSRQERYQVLRGVTIFPEDLGSVSITLITVTPVLGKLMPSSDLYGHQTYTGYIDTHADRVSIHTK